VVDMSVRLSADEAWDVISRSHTANYARSRVRRATLVAEVVRDVG
jgi:hypothetical protein